MKTIICKDYAEMSREAAKIVAEQMKAKPTSVLGFATGSSPVGLYNCLAEMNKAGEIDFSQVTTFNLDEYYPIKRDNDQSYWYFMWKNLFSHVNVRKEAVHVPNGEVADPDAECAAYDAAIEAAGGIDLQILGIGRNGHIGFNEPADKFVYGTQIVNLTESTIDANTRFFENKDQVPRKAISLGIGGIMNAKEVVLIAMGADKAQAIHDTVYGEINPQVQASILRSHPHVTILVDKAAASLL